MQRRLLLLGGLAYGLLLIGLATLDGRVIVLALPLLTYLGAAALGGPRRLDLRAIRTVTEDRVSQGASVGVELSVTNHGGGLEEVLIEDIVPESLVLASGQSRVLSSLPSSASITLRYTVVGPRGHFDFGGVRVSASDHFGILQRQGHLPAPGRIVVLPNTRRLRRVGIRPLQTRAYAGPIPARQGGSGVEFYGVREYQLGDPLRSINWRANARHPRTLFANEFQRERIADVGLILDARQRSDVRGLEESLFEHAVRATASIAESFLNDGNRVGLLIYGAVRDWTFAGYGKTQRERILQALARARPAASIVFDRLDYLPTRLFPARSQLVLVSPVRQDDLPILIRLRARGYQLLVVSPDPVSLGAQALGLDPEHALAPRVARIERVLLAHRLRQAGIRFVDWRTDKPLDQAIHTSLGRVPHWFRFVESTGRTGSR